MSSRVSAIPAPRKSTWRHEYYVRPVTDEANEQIARVLERQTDDVSAFARNMRLPGYAQKQDVFAVSHAIMVDIENISSISTGFKAYVRYAKDGAVHRYRTRAQAREIARLQAIRAIRRQAVKRSVAR